MPRRPDPEDGWLPGQPILAVTPTEVLPPPTYTYECTKCGSRSFAIDHSRPTVDPRWVIGKCRERVRKDRTCTGTIARAATKEHAGVQTTHPSREAGRDQTPRPDDAGGVDA